ncbi:hypothetical protein J6590_003541 [Homalodisca vitripennis]|nr:hypothetical protein J6590_003541 [Homalodisca vitripennis]
MNGGIRRVNLYLADDRTCICRDGIFPTQWWAQVPDRKQEPRCSRDLSPCPYTYRGWPYPQNDADKYCLGPINRAPGRTYVSRLLVFGAPIVDLT